MNSLLSILTNRRYFATAFVFASLNVVYGSWAIYIPYIKENLNIDKAQLGIAIFFLALGNLTILTVAPKIIRHFGSGKTTKYTIISLSLACVLPFLSFNYYSLITALFVQGAVQGLLDISMNNLVSVVEKKEGVKLMSAMHGFFSLGGVFAGLGTFIIIWLDNPILHISIIALSLLFINIYLSKEYSEVKDLDNNKTPIDFSYLKSLFLLGLISFVIMGSEGAIIDWSGLYLKEVNLAPTKLLGAGFLGFSIAMTIGRFLGDSLSEKIGSIAVLLLGTFIASIGYVFVLTSVLVVTIIGFVLIGLGFSVMVPELFRITANTPNIESSKALALIAGCGYSGFLIGPVILGLIAERYGLEYSFYGLLSCCIFVLIISSYLLIKTRKTV